MLQRTAIWLMAALLLGSATARAEVRIKDLTDLEGARNNQLYGFGLVVGLDRSGSRSLFTQQVASDMLQRLNVRSTIIGNLPNDPVLSATNISAVMVTAEIGPYARPGSRLDVVVSSMDDARSLQGGTLLLTPLHGADGDVYAVAQGPLSIGGFAAAGAAANVQKNHPTAGRIASGAIVEKEPPGQGVCKSNLHLLVRDPDFNTARLIAKGINERFPGSSVALDAGTVQVAVPPDRCLNPMPFVGEIGLLTITPDAPARVVINERTGTVVAGENVKISTTAVAQGNLVIVTVETPEVSQPNEFSRGTTTVVPRTQVGVTEEKSRLIVVPKALTVAELARALNALGVTPRDLISIFQALKQAGALHAELIVM